MIFHFIDMNLMFPHKGAVQDQGASVGGLLLFPCSQPQKAGARSGGKATP